MKRVHLPSLTRDSTAPRRAHDSSHPPRPPPSSPLQANRARRARRLLDLRDLSLTAPAMRGAAPVPRHAHSATLLDRGRVLIFGGVVGPASVQDAPAPSPR